MKASRVLGIMSGTSIDSVDYASCRITDKSVELEKLWSADFPDDLRKNLHRAAANEATSYDVGQMHHDLGRFYAAHAKKVKRPDFVGLHGQTVFHNPDKKAPATIQLGEPAYLVEALGAPVVSNFRSADIAAGGQGAPLATIFHQFVFARRGEHVCVNNLGGISNVTSMDWRRGSQPNMLAFDTGPANVLIDLAMRHFTRGAEHMDANGTWAARGEVCKALVQRWLRHEYFHRKPPKSTGRELFGEPFFKTVMRETKRLSKFDVLATFTEFTARSLALNYERHLPSVPDRLILTGGGAANPQLVKGITAQFPPTTQVMTSESLGWPVQAIEPAAFALLAWLRMNGKPGNLPQTTGARRAVLCGQVSR
ncbi:MAG: anhydro-N-acetylmuramic acid kinase [Limisphaerales bacterium]